MQLLQCLICEKAQPSIRDHPQDGGPKASVEGPQPFLPGYSDEDMDDAAIPVRE